MKKKFPVKIILLLILFAVLFVTVIVPAAVAGLLLIDGGVRGTKYDQMQTGVTENGTLRVTADGTSSQGSHWDTRLVGSAIVPTAEFQTSQGLFTATSIRQVYEYEAVSAGGALVLVNSRADANTDLYSVTVDEELRISYESRSTQRLFMYDREGTFFKDGTETKLSPQDFRELTWLLCGSRAEADSPPREELDGLPMLEVFDEEHYFDTKKGMVYIFEQGSEGGSVFKVDEWLLPQFAETFG